MSELAALKSELTGWLFERALPLWADAGVDASSGAFQEALDHSGRPLALPRRARVQTRQTYVFAWAGARGDSADWSELAGRGFDAFLARHRRPDGLFRTLAAVDGSPLDEEAPLYDQAFALFALGAVMGSDRRAAAEAAAAELRLALEGRRHPAGGFLETGPRPFQSNPHMHLFEAALAWEGVSGDAAWTALADELAELALARFVDSEGGFLREFFDAEWRPAQGPDGRIVEPGHQFEWAWLLDRWAGRRGDARGRAAAHTLYRIGADRGVDPARGVVIDELSDDLSTLSARARLWPQTERLRAALRFGDRPGAAEAARALLSYFDTPIAGLWRDKLRPDGGFVEEPAPASSLYHIVGAIDALIDA